MDLLPGDAVGKIRARLTHPVVDGDGHLIEYLPLVRDLLVEEAGTAVAERFDRMTRSASLLRAVPPGDARRRLGLARNAWWGLPTANTLDRATAMLPGLLARRLDEIGIDFALLYPTYGLTVLATPDDELRCAMARAYNRYYAAAYAEVRDRLEPVAVIPTYTPAEAVTELRHAVETLGLKAVVMAGVVKRPVPGVPGATYVDSLGHESAHDYRPLWEECRRLKVAPTFHAPGMGWGSRVSTTNYVHNHLGNFAAAAEATARGLLLGGVPVRFPELRFGFLEGGAAWACALYADVIAHHAKRGPAGIGRYDPARLDREALRRLFAEHAPAPVRERLDRLDDALVMLSEPGEDEATVDEFAESGVRSAEDLVEVFTRRYFVGCEADDPMTALAFDTRVNPYGARLRAVFASDIGHWDVPDVREVLPDAWELVETGRLSEEDFAAFAFGNVVDLLGPDFFTGTAVEAAVR